MKKKILFLILLKLYLAGDIVIADDVNHHQLSRLNFSLTGIPVVEKKLTEFSRTEKQVDINLAEHRADNNGSGLVIERYRKSAMSGDAEAQFQLGLLYIDDDLNEDERGIGMFWVEQAAEQGHHQARVVIDSLEREDASFGC